MMRKKVDDEDVNATIKEQSKYEKIRGRDRQLFDESCANFYFLCTVTSFVELGLSCVYIIEQLMFCVNYS